MRWNMEINKCNTSSIKSEVSAKSYKEIMERRLMMLIFFFTHSSVVKT